MKQIDTNSRDSMLSTHEGYYIAEAQAKAREGFAKLAYCEDRTIHAGGSRIDDFEDYLDTIIAKACTAGEDAMMEKVLTFIENRFEDKEMTGIIRQEYIKNDSRIPIL